MRDKRHLNRETVAFQSGLSGVTVADGVITLVNENLSLAAGGTTRSLSPEVLDGCIRSSATELLPWKYSDPFIPIEVETWYSAFIQGVILPVLFLVSAPTNAINMAVFYRQGLKERINFCLFWRSLSDLVHMTWTYCSFAESLYSQIVQGNIYGVVFTSFVKNNLYIMTGFSCVSAVTTTIIAFERCFCVVRPFLSRNIIKTSTMAVILVFTSAVVMVGFYFMSVKWDLICLLDPVTNTRVMWEYPSKEYMDNKNLVDAIEETIYGLVFPASCILVVTVTTAITTISLHKMTAWRESSVTSVAVTSSRDLALTRTLIGVFLLFLACYIPAFLLHSVGVGFPEVHVGGRMQNTYNVLVHTALLCTYINPSFTFFIFYKTSSRYRKMLRGLVCTGVPRTGPHFTKKSKSISWSANLTTAFE